MHVSIHWKAEANRNIIPSTNSATVALYNCQLSPIDVLSWEYIGSTSIRGGYVVIGISICCVFCVELGKAIEFRADNVAIGGLLISSV